MFKPIIAISAGDPAGIGPEICAKALLSENVYSFCSPLVICDAQVIEWAIDFCKLSLKINKITSPEQGLYSLGTIDVLDIKNIDPMTFSYGQVSKMTGKASFEYVIKAIELALAGKVDATVTGPINKEAIHLAGYNFAGHTEIFAHFTKTSKYAMMLADHDFRVIHVNTHMSMLDSIKNTTTARVLDTIQLASMALIKMGIKNPRIAVNGLNPHAGENGLFGKEEIEQIIPAIREAVKQGIDADGPHPPDTIFSKMKGGQYDCVVCMYHDQGHIPTKLMGFRYNHEANLWEGMSGVNITLGLPIIRVSVDHGTAFDKAGKNEANPESMLQALTYAAKFTLNN
ncbi:MAG: 4-hydroxythreonine-4-phosphate dehydrogenase PdxA [Bacteroidales bacterium]|nr:4-hydroxythreonine-4-phosphate dehydrogenase PdxA [Bacteroidales bacterium]MCF8391307.1 4-hydroxythreonine-4-phosphate dehydrogenase PdxA [Bacteroidales bacterium]